jgi:hypothetical protein
MKKGLILYVAAGKEEVPLNDFTALCRAALMPGISVAYVATSEDEAMYGWWHLIARGMHQVWCTVADYNAELCTFEWLGNPYRLCG